MPPVPGVCLVAATDRSPKDQNMARANVLSIRPNATTRNPPEERARQECRGCAAGGRVDLDRQLKTPRSESFGRSANDVRETACRSRPESTFLQNTAALLETYGF